jgi:hypothetical protein
MASSQQCLAPELLRPADDYGVCAVLCAFAERNWRPGRHFGRRLTRVAPMPRPPAPLYTRGTAVRIERLRLLDLDGEVSLR